MSRCICGFQRAQRRADTNSDTDKFTKERHEPNTCAEGGRGRVRHPRKWTCAKVSESLSRLFSIYTIAASYHSPASSEDSEHTGSRRQHGLNMFLKYVKEAQKEKSTRSERHRCDGSRELTWIANHPPPRCQRDVTIAPDVFWAEIVHASRSTPLCSSSHFRNRKGIYIRSGSERSWMGTATMRHDTDI